jgi:translation initiation factor IF-2
VAAKIRVWEIAQAADVESSDVISKLAEINEFVKSASSSVEPFVFKKLKAKFPELNVDVVPGAVKKAATKKAAIKKAAEAPAEVQDVTDFAPVADVHEPTATAEPVIDSAPATPGAIPRPPAPRPGPRPPNLSKSDSSQEKEMKRLFTQRSRESV